MRFFLSAALFAAFVWSHPLQAKVPEGVMNCDAEQEVECTIFWNRQSDEAKRFILSHKGDDRNVALTCYALNGYKDITAVVRECTQSLIGDRRSMRHCEKQGFELLSAKMEKCRRLYRNKKGYPQPY